jgi:hypothetical protein
MLRRLRTAFAFSAVALCAVSAFAQTVTTLSNEQSLSLKSATSPAACSEAALRIVAQDETLLEQISRSALTVCPDGTAALLAEALARKYPARIEDIAVWMTASRPEAIGEIVLSALGTLPEEQRLAAFDRVIARIRRDVPGIANSEAFAAIPGIGELSGLEFTPYLFPLLLEENGGPLQGPGEGVSPS